MASENKKIKVLYIDDEHNNLLSFQAAFRRKYKIVTALSASEGMNILKQ
jgi:response regulator RpfG family c-di-GMP phosphodiesterase